MEKVIFVKDGHFINRTQPLEIRCLLSYNVFINKNQMKPKLRTILEVAINEGITVGYRRAYKHTDEPNESWVIETIENEIMNCIDLYFDFEEND